ncbi:MAG: hypothetical protein FJY67_05445 [Calditrichaeota bacterium]|nr:hypothetical protein [Calditrichota bacterium]
MRSAATGGYPALPPKRRGRQEIWRQAPFASLRRAFTIPSRRLSYSTGFYLRKYLANRPQGIPRDALFCTASYRDITPRQINALLQRWAGSAGIGSVSPRILRYALALRGGV